jgi:hypothetical protein
MKMPAGMPAGIDFLVYFKDGTNEAKTGSDLRIYFRFVLCGLGVFCRAGGLDRAFWGWCGWARKARTEGRWGLISGTVGREDDPTQAEPGWGTSTCGSARRFRRGCECAAQPWENTAGAFR